EVKIVMQPIVTGLLAPSRCSAIFPPEYRLIETRSVIDQLPSRIIEQRTNHPRIFLARPAREHRLERFAHIRHCRTSPDEVPRAIDHHPLCVRRYAQRVVRYELEPPAVALTHRGIDPGVEIAIDRHDVVRPGIALDIVPGTPRADPDPSCARLARD